MARQAGVGRVESAGIRLTATTAFWIPAATYQQRIDAALGRALGEGHAGLIVYGDREHSANYAAT